MPIPVNPNSIRHGDYVLLIKAGSSHDARRGGKIKINTRGRVIVMRDDDDGRKYLVKFEGHNAPRHCDADQIEKELAENRTNGFKSINITPYLPK